MFERRDRLIKPQVQSRLSPRQSTICELLLHGLSNKEIGRQLGMSARTVEWHRGEIYRKKHVKNAIDLVRQLYEERIEALEALTAVAS